MEIMWAMHLAKTVGITLVHTQVKENELTKEIWTRPWVQGSSADTIGNVPDLIGYLNVKNTARGPVRTLQLAPKATMITGNRFEHKLEDLMENPTLSDVYAVIRNEVE